MTEERIIRKMLFEDIEKLANAFIQRGWPDCRETLKNYFLEQEAGERQVLVAVDGTFLSAYITVIPSAKHGPLQAFILSSLILMFLKVSKDRALARLYWIKRSK